MSLVDSSALMSRVNLHYFSTHVRVYYTRESFFIYRKNRFCAQFALMFNVETLWQVNTLEGIFSLCKYSTWDIKYLLVNWMMKVGYQKAFHCCLDCFNWFSIPVNIFFWVTKIQCNESTLSRSGAVSFFMEVGWTHWQLGLQIFII